MEELIVSKTNSNSKKKIQNHCSPAALVTSGSTCFSRELLVMMTRLYNRSRTNAKDQIPIASSKTDLWQNLHDRLHTRCGSKETCWMDQPFAKNARDKMETAFRPPKPKAWYSNQKEWLSTYDIVHVMKQYEDAHANFGFLGVFPIDFASKNARSGSCVVQEMCSLDIRSTYKKKQTRIGVVFNTDKHDQSGSHWISLFIGLSPRSKNFGVFFYDSVAMKPPKELQVFMKKVEADLKDLHPAHADKVVVRTNTIRKQWKNSECGVFSMLFIISMLKYGFDETCARMGKDDEVNKFRDILYRPSIDA
jgi:Adenovirus endoprotease